MSDDSPQALDAVAPLDTSYDVMVLLVDDQVMVAEAVRRALVSHGQMDFHYCAQPDQAITVAKDVKPTVILQDLVMPGVDGLDLVRQYRQDPATASIPIIVLSTKDEPAVKSAAFAAGANDYLVKLPDKIELIARVRYHSIAYLNQVQRDAAYRALRESQRALMEANLELQRLTKVDGLTGLGNRRYFDEYIAAEWQRAIRTQSPLSVLMIDVDNFKRYNDTYGHLAGDQVLRELAEIIQLNCNRSTDLGARYGGEEFVVILCDTPAAGARMVGEKLLLDIATLHLPHKASGVVDHVTVSIGGASTIPQQHQSERVLIGAADAALYHAKRDGRNRVVMNAHMLSVSGDGV
jgi:two-component system chemotaxis family response regulator WspR